MDHSLTYKEHHSCLYLVSVHQTAPPPIKGQTSNCSLLLIYRPREDERLSWPSWLTSSEWFIHISGNPSAEGRACDTESSPAKTDVLATVPHHQQWWGTVALIFSLQPSRKYVLGVPLPCHNYLYKAPWRLLTISSHFLYPRLECICNLCQTQVDMFVVVKLFWVPI